MKMSLEEVGPVVIARLEGRLDIVGAHAIDLQFNVLSGSRRAIVVDLSGVSFMASMGLRTLVMGAKTVASKKGKMVLLAPTAEVGQVLADMGTEAILPVFADRDSAIAAVS